MLIRPIARSDLPSLFELARVAGQGLSPTLPSEDSLARWVELSRESFSGSPQGKMNLLFAFEDEGRARLIGTSGIASELASDEVRYCFRVGTSVSCSREIGVHRQLQTLFLTNDQTGASELTGLYLHPEYRRGGNGALLSLSRLLYVAEFPQRFAERFVAGLRGLCDANGGSPFWAGLGRHFYRADPVREDYLSGVSGRSLIGELMPQHPVYTAFLPDEARAAIGVCHPTAKPARALLETEGFHSMGHVDIFDGGPILEAARHEIRSVRMSRIVEAVVADAPEGAPHLVSNRSAEDFRVIVAQGRQEEGSFALSGADLDRLGVASGQGLRVMPLAR